MALKNICIGMYMLNNKILEIIEKAADKTIRKKEKFSYQNLKKNFNLPFSLRMLKQ